MSGSVRDRAARVLPDMVRDRLKGSARELATAIGCAESSARTAIRDWLDVTLARPTSHAAVAYVSPRAGYAPRRTPGPAREPLAIVAPIYDAHIGQSTYPSDRARVELLAASRRLADLAVRLGDVATVAVVFGGDWLHADTWRGTTTGGTVVDAPNPARAAGDAIDIAASVVDTWRAVSPHTRVATLIGNHDAYSATLVGGGLSTVFRNVLDVDVLRAASRCYLAHGGSLWGLHHGDTVSHTEAESIMATDVPELWAQCPHRYWITGHRHQVHETTVGGVIVMQQPSPAPQSVWSDARGYRSVRALRAYAFGSGGHVATLNVTLGTTGAGALVPAGGAL